MAPFWVTPLLLLPGVALLVMSTQARYGQLHEEMHRLIEHHHEHDMLARDLLKRGRLFRDALVCLYAACGVFGLGALLGGLAEQSALMAEMVAFPLTMFGALLLVAASVPAGLGSSTLPARPRVSRAGAASERWPAAPRCRLSALRRCLC